MTAYACVTLDTSIGTITIEIQSVNRKHFDINCLLPSAFSHCEEVVRKKVAEQIHRGHIQIKIYFKNNETKLLSIEPNLALAKQYQLGWQKIAQELGISASENFSLNFLSQVSDLFILVKEPRLEALASEALENALTLVLDDLQKRKKEEGRHLFHDIKNRIELLKKKICEIELLTPHALERYKTNLIEKLSAALSEHFQSQPSGHIHDEQILKALCIFADKIDVTEELVRFKAHLEHFIEIATKEERAGKTLDFLVQELNREANTIASKASDAAISQGIVAIKSELERIREQLQNIE